jgi:putative ATP-binding cassette transporter
MALAQIEPGERVLVAGPPGSGKCQLLRAAAGLSAEGSGVILLPDAKDTMFIPSRPYLPLGRLRGAVTYPDDGDRFADTTVHRALERVGLGRLISRLDDKERWDRTLSTGEQQRLALARLLLHAPSWVFFEDTLSAMDEDDCQLMRSIFGRELLASTVVGVGNGPALNGFYRRTLWLRRSVEHQPDAFVSEVPWPLAALQAAE